MLHMTTGLPGAGKTLITLAMIKARAEKENRQVYYDGIEILQPDVLPWISLDGKPWFDAPDGSIVVIDEAQRRYRPRGLGAAVPDEVAKLETHRHRGFDIYFVTQHPMLVDSNVRRLVNIHFHVMRKFGMQSAVVHEFPTGVKDNPDKVRTDSIRHDWSYPKSLYAAYKSAEVHTHKRRLPMRVWLLFCLPLVLVPVVYKAGKWFYEASNGTKAQQLMGDKLAGPAAAGSAPGGGGAAPVSHPVRSRENEPLTPQEVAASYTPRIPDLPHTAPRYDQLTQAQTVPVVSACIQSETLCKCYSQQGTVIHVSETYCRNFSAHPEFRDFEAPELPSTAARFVPSDNGTGGVPAPAVPPAPSAGVVRS